MAIIRQHHPYSPSKLQALEASPCFTSSNEETEASLAGSLQHEAAEEKIDIDDPDLTDDQALAVYACRKYRDDLIAKYPGGLVLKETEVSVDDAVVIGPGTNGPETRWAGTTSGFLDFAVISSDLTEAEITDWKFGMWSVEAAELNLQGWSYVLGLKHKYPALKKITMHFYMPHREEIEVATFTEDQFPAMLLRIQTVVARAIEAHKTQNCEKCEVRLKSCLFCANKGICYPLAATMLQVSKKYAPIEIPANLQPSIIKDPASSSQLMGISQLMESWCKAIRTQITNHAIENVDWLPDDYVVQERTDSEVKDWKKVKEAALAAGITEAQFDAALTVTMTPIDKYISDLNPRGEKKMAIKVFKEGLLKSGAMEKGQPYYFLRRLKS